MNRVTRLIYACTLALGFAGSASAFTLVDQGSTTHDTATSLEWLDLTLTNGLSPDAALAANAGFRWATLGEVHQMFLNGGMTAVDNVFRVSDTPAAGFLTALFGITFGTGPSSYGFQGFAAAPSSVFANPFLQIAGGAAKVFPGHTGFSSSQGIGAVGVFMVRDVAAVPLPATMGGLLMGCAALGLFGRRRAT